ncbi:hypothetical protein H5P28_18290 [Ruficoccus amylovorans]|uniref:PEP-CTERM sorting domain-containing protein n=1 Tax=Ruficoccus amylovorans TaxID=1804625 RepID=A0A842HIJ3_9BACT|nr:hypothetical protein [Ruficoccus amylovorans]MBC2596222.1 hypothetical protein [Ruficoccus amylovorans]
MKLTLLASGLSLLIAAPFASGVTYAVDDFESYSLGSINGNNGGTGWSGAWTGSGGQNVVDTSANPLSYTVNGGNTVTGGGKSLQLSGTSEYAAYRDLSSAQTGAIYISYLMRVEGTTIENNDFASMWLNNPGTASTNPGPSTGFKANNGDGAGTEDFFIRPYHDGTNAGYAGDVNLGETYLVVAKFEASGANGDLYDTFSLWINPDAWDENNADVTYTGASYIDELTRLGFRSANLDHGTTVLIDNFTTTDNFGEAIGGMSPAAVPFDPGAGLGMAFVGWFAWRRFKRRLSEKTVA